MRQMHLSGRGFPAYFSDWIYKHLSLVTYHIYQHFQLKVYILLLITKKHIESYSYFSLKHLYNKEYLDFCSNSGINTEK